MNNMIVVSVFNLFVTICQLSIPVFLFLILHKTNGIYNEIKKEDKDAHK